MCCVIDKILIASGEIYTREQGIHYPSSPGLPDWATPVLRYCYFNTRRIHLKPGQSITSLNYICLLQHGVFTIALNKTENIFKSDKTIRQFVLPQGCLGMLVMLVVLRMRIVRFTIPHSCTSITEELRVLSSCSDCIRNVRVKLLPGSTDKRFPLLPSFLCLSRRLSLLSCLCLCIPG